MNNFGEFLYSLRKEKGMTQAELAELLDITNKAVSKWETGEAMPETGLLLPLSRIFGVTADELLSGKRKEKTEKDETLSEAIANGHIFSRGKDDEENKTFSDKICGAVCATVFLIGTAAYLFLGAFAGLWNPYWFIIPVCALSCGIIGILFEMCNPQKRESRKARGESPFAVYICGLAMLACLISYFIAAALTGLWHPLWIIPVCGVVFCGIVGSVFGISAHKKK